MISPPKLRKNDSGDYDPMEQVVYLQEETIKLSGMIDNGLGWEDLKEDVNGK